MKKKILGFLKDFLRDIVVILGPIIICGIIGQLVGDLLGLPYELNSFVFVFSALVLGVPLVGVIINKIFK